MLILLIKSNFECKTFTHYFYAVVLILLPKMWVLLPPVLVWRFIVHSVSLQLHLFLTGDSQEDSVAVVLHKQPTGGVYQSFVCELFQPRAIPGRQLASPGALGWLLHPLEPSHETSGMRTWRRRFVRGSCLHTIVCKRCTIVKFELFFFLARNLFISATRSCWRSALSCRREWTSYSERWPTARPPLPPNGRALQRAPSRRCRPSFDTTQPSRRSHNPARWCHRPVISRPHLAPRRTCAPNCLFGWHAFIHYHQKSD